MSGPGGSVGGPMAGRWWLAPKGRVAQAAVSYIRGLDTVQAHIYNRFIRLEALYAMQRQRLLLSAWDPTNEGMMTQNLIASNVDTVAAQIASTDVRAVFDTDDGDWGEQRRARQREHYAAGLSTLLNVPEKCQHSFKVGSALKGTSLLKVYADRFKCPRVDNVLVDDIVVDELECRNAPPMQFHYRVSLDREELCAQFPGKRLEIEKAQSTGDWRLWAGYRPLQRNQVMVFESWRLPIGPVGHDDYQPGRHAITIDGCDLLDEEYAKPFFPFAIQFWERPPSGWYGIGLAEQIAGIQRVLNRRNHQKERQLDQYAYPITYVSQANAAISVMVQNEIGTIVPYVGNTPPKTEFPPAVSPETYNDIDRLPVLASQVSGVSTMASQATKPAGIETGVALREYRDQTTQRFARQEKGYEQFYLDVIFLLLDVCKDLGADAPVIPRGKKFGGGKIPWAKVDMENVRIQLGAASTLSRTRAGREQAVVEWSQAGIISQDDAKRLLDHPDLDRALSLYNAAIENVDYVIEEIADGNIMMPEPYMNLKLLVWRAQQQYLIWSTLKRVPETVLENLRQLITQAAWMVSGGNQPPEGALPPGPGPDQSMPAGAPPPGGMLPPGGGMPPMPAGPPMGMPPMAAFAPQAMQLQPG